jgi:hypothetical protein
VAESAEGGRRDCGHGLLLVKSSSKYQPSCCRDRYGGWATICVARKQQRRWYGHNIFLSATVRCCRVLVAMRVA